MPSTSPSTEPPRRRSAEKLAGRCAGSDGCTAVTYVLDPATDSAVCPEVEEAVAASAVNKFLAEFLARARKFNKSSSLFTADLQAYKNSEHVDDAFKNGLKGLDTYAQVSRKLKQVGECTFPIFALAILAKFVMLYIEGNMETAQHVQSLTAKRLTIRSRDDDEIVDAPNAQSIRADMPIRDGSSHFVLMIH